MPQQRRGRTQPLGKPAASRKPPTKSNSSSAPSKITNGRREKSPSISLAAICPLLMSWVQPLKPEQQDKSLEKVPAGQTPISRLELGGTDHRRRLARAVPGATAQNHLAAGPTRSLDESKPAKLLDLLRDYESRNVTFIEPDGSWPIVWERAQGVHVWDADGSKYLDLTAAFGVAAAAMPIRASCAPASGKWRNSCTRWATCIRTP